MRMIPQRKMTYHVINGLAGGNPLTGRGGERWVDGMGGPLLLFSPAPNLTKHTPVSKPVVVGELYYRRRKGTGGSEVPHSILPPPAIPPNISQPGVPSVSPGRFKLPHTASERVCWGSSWNGRPGEKETTAAPIGIPLPA
jgi:hypothetical protein